MFVLGISMQNKEDQKAVYPRIGPIYGYFEIASLIILIGSGFMMISSNGLLDILFSNVSNEVIDSLRVKLYLVAVVVVFTVIHTIISFQTIYMEKTSLQKFFSRGSSMGIFLLNLVVLHYAMVIRDIL